MRDCVFCSIVAGQRAASRVYEDEETLAFLDLNQPNPGHVLVIPKRHVEDIYDLDPETSARLFQGVVIVARAVRASLHPHGLSVWQANGPAAGQSVFHVHVHLLPRYTGDGLLSMGHHSLVRIGRAELDELAARISRAIEPGPAAHGP